MKLQIAFDLTDLDKATTVAQTLIDQADIIEIGTLLLYKHGEKAILKFRELFPNKTIVADAKIVDRAKETAALLINAGADFITVMAGTDKQIIHTGCTTAHDMGKKVMLDMLDASSLGQSALEAKSLGADALIFHYLLYEQESTYLQDTWEMVKGNTHLPIFISAKITPETIDQLVPLNPYGLIISATDATIDTTPDLLLTIRSAFSL